MNASRPIRLQRASGAARLAVCGTSGATRLGVLYQEGAAKIGLPRVPRGAPIEAVLINTAGGLTGGDALQWHVEAGAGGHLVVTTQACEKIYRAACGVAETRTALRVGPASRLAWLPQETILFNESALKRSIEAEIATDGACLILEPVIFGRGAMGEAVTGTSLCDRWRIRCEGRLVHAEDMRLQGDAAALLRRRAIGAGAGAMASLIFLAPDAGDRLDAVRRLLAEAGDGATGAASAWRVGGTGKLLARILASDGFSLRRVVMPLVKLLNGQAGLPRIWTN